METIKLAVDYGIMWMRYCSYEAFVILSFPEIVFTN